MMVFICGYVTIRRRIILGILKRTIILTTTQIASYDNNSESDHPNSQEERTMENHMDTWFIGVPQIGGAILGYLGFYIGVSMFKETTI